MIINWRKFEDNKGEIRSPKSKKGRQCNDRKKKDKQWVTKRYTKTKDLTTRTHLNTGCELRRSGRVNCFCSTSGPICDTLATHSGCVFGLISWKIPKKNQIRDKLLLLL